MPVIRNLEAEVLEAMAPDEYNIIHDISLQEAAAFYAFQGAKPDTSWDDRADEEKLGWVPQNYAIFMEEKNRFFPWKRSCDREPTSLAKLGVPVIMAKFRASAGQAASSSLCPLDELFIQEQLADFLFPHQVSGCFLCAKTVAESSHFA